MTIIKTNNLGPATIAGLQATRPGASRYRRLAAAVIKRAIVDLKARNDPILSLDALCFWLESGPDWLDMLDIPPDDYFCKLVEECTNGK